MPSAGITQCVPPCALGGVHHGVSERGQRVNLTFMVNYLRETCDSDPKFLWLELRP
jgi:hypothetical protein